MSTRMGFSLAFLINFVSALLMTGLGFFVLRREPKAGLNRLFALISVTLAFWVFASALTDIPPDLESSLFYAELAFVGPTLFVPFLVLFVRRFPPSPDPLPLPKLLLMVMPVLALLPFVFSPYNIVSIERKSWGVDFVPGPLYLGLFAYILFGFAASAWELRRKRRLEAGLEQRAQLKFIALALGLTIVFGTLANLVLPLLGYTRAAVFGPASTLLFVLFTAYAMVKHHLLDVKVIAAELFGILLTFVTFFQIFSADSVADYALRIFIFVATAVVAIFLIRSVLKEVEGRQKIEKQAVELDATNRRLRKLDDLKTTMVSIASHQLRGPLGGMRGYMTMFRDGDLGPLSDKQKEIVGMNLNVLSRLLNAVETFLDITKLESGKMLLKKEVLPFDDAVEDVWKEFRILFEKKAMTFDLKIDAPRPVFVEFDPEKIKHVVFNLIDNALKYTERGSVTVSLRLDGRQALLEVSDTGMGIPPEDVHRLFGKFERGELVVDRGGSGLGLYVVKMLTELQGGKVWVSSPGTGKGSTFHVSLPLSAHFDPPKAA